MTFLIPIPGRAKALPDFVAQAFRTVDLILHAGDINDLTVLKALNELAPTEAMAGKTDPPGIIAALGFSGNWIWSDPSEYGY